MVCPTVNMVQDTGIGRRSQGQAQHDGMIDAFQMQKSRDAKNANISMSVLLMACFDTYTMACFDTYTQCVCS